MLKRTTRLSALLLALVMVLSVVMAVPRLTYAADGAYTDVGDGHTFKNYIGYVSEKGAFEGDGGKFMPEASIKRGQVAAVLARALDLELDAVSDFPDVPEDHIFTKDIAAVTAKGIFGGYADGKFRPEAFITRGQAAKVIANAFDYELVLGKALKFDDVKEGDPFKDYIDILTSNGVLSGDGNLFNPDGEVTRGQFAKYLAAPMGYFEPVEVVSATAIDATTISVTLSDGSVHDVTLEEELKQNVATEVEFTIDGNDYTATVTWIISSDIVEEELEAAKADLQAKEDALEEAEKDVFEAEQEIKRANKFGTEAEKKAAKRALEDAKEVRDDAKVERDTAWTKVNELKDKLADAKDYEKVVKAVEKAEKSNKQADRDAADVLLNNSKGGDIYDALRIRLNKVDKVIGAIASAEAALDNVPAVEDVNLSHRQLVKIARAAVDAVLKLDPNAQIDKAKMEKLVEAEEKIAKIDADQATDKEAADKVIALIKALPSDVKLTLEDKEDVEAARAAFEELTDAQKARVEKAPGGSGKGALENREAQIKVLEEAQVVIDMIEALPKEEDFDFGKDSQDRKDVKAARKAYNELDAKPRVIANTKSGKKLLDIENAIDAYDDMDLTGLGYTSDDYAEVKFVGFKISDTEKIEFALYQGNTKQRTITAKEKVWEDLKDSNVIGGNLKGIDPKYWDYDGEFGEDLTKANQIKVTITLKNGKVLKADKSI